MSKKITVLLVDDHSLVRRGFLALRGQAVYVPAGGGPRVVGNLQQGANELKAIIRTSDWNQIHIIARGAFCANCAHDEAAGVPAVVSWIRLNDWVFE